MTNDWASVRARFPIAERCIYLNTGWSGPSSRETVAAMQRRLEREAYDGPASLAVRHEKAQLVRAARAAIARLIGASEDEVALMYTTTEGVNTVLRGLGLGPGNEVITCNLEHNAVMVPAYMARERDGVDLTILRFSPEDGPAEIIDAFARAVTARTKLLVVSHVSYNRGTRLPMREICEMAHRAGALVAVDAAQSAGQIAFDVGEMGCDFLMLPGHKWLLGPDGAAFLYVRRDHIERLQPLAVVHGANRRYDFEGHFEPALDTIHKFELTTHSGPVLAGLLESLRLFDEAGLPAIQARCVELASRFIDTIAKVDGVRITSPLAPALRSGIATFAVRDLSPHQTCAALDDIAGAVGRVCNDRRVRVCFHVFTDESDADATAAAVAEIAAHGIPARTMSEARYKELLAESED